MTTSSALPARYTRTAIALHWIIAALIAGAFAIVWVVDYLPEDWERPAINLHKSFGLTVLGLAVMRLLWRATHRPPAMPAGYPKRERMAAHLAHAALYGLIVFMPLSGYLHDSAFKDAAAHPLYIFGLIPFPRVASIAEMEPVAREAYHAQMYAVHGFLGWVLLGLFAAHVAGALKHQWWDGERELQRMGVGRSG